jgi:hypothetical protein
MLDWEERPVDPLPGTSPAVIPDNRVLLRQRGHTEPTPISDLVKDAIFIRGTISGLDAHGVAWLRSQVVHPALKRCDLVFSLYGGCPTWDDVLLDALDLQDANTDRVAFRVLARRIGQDRPANLLWLQAEMSEPGVIVVGNVSNFMVGARWDPTDAVVVTAIDAAGADALRRWFDSVHAHSRALTSITARAPRLRLPEGTAEGERMWREYLKTLDEAVPIDVNPDAEITVDPDTGEIKDAPELTPTQAKAIAQIDPVLLAVQAALAKGTLVSIDRVGRAPPLDMPVRAEMFGEAGEQRAGAARRKQSFSITVFDEKTAKLLENRRNEIGSRLSAFSLMLREGERWMPAGAFALFEKEMRDAEEKAKQALAKATGGMKADAFVDSQAAKIEEDCRKLAQQIGPDRRVSPALMQEVRTGLIKRLSANLDRGMACGISRTVTQLSSIEDQRQSPWGAVQTFLTSAAKLPRELITDPFRVRGLVVNRDELIKAFDVFGDALVCQYLGGQRVDRMAERELELIGQIVADMEATPWQRSQALHRLIQGQGEEAILSALREPNPTPTRGPSLCAASDCATTSIR